MLTFVRRATAMAAAVVGTLALASCGAGGGATSDTPLAKEQVTELAVGITPIANAASLYIALEQGFFEDEGLQVTPSIIQTAATAIPSLLNDELQVALMTSVPVVTAASKNLPITVVAGSDRYPQDGSQDTTALVAASNSGVAALGDLEGKTIALVGLKSAPDLALRVVLAEAGVDPADVEIVEIAYPDMVPSLGSNRVDAAFIVDPFLSQAKAAGLPVISQPFTDGLGGMSALQWVVSDAFVAANPDTAARFAAAMERAGEYANENPEALRDVLPSFTSLPPQVIENSVLPSTYDAELTTDDIQAYVELMTREGFIDRGFDPEGLLWSQDDE